MAVIKVYNGTSWVEVNVKHWNGTAWIDHETKYWNGTAWASLEGSAGSPVVSMTADGATNIILGQTCYAGPRFLNTGAEQEYNASGGVTAKGNWLDSGAAADVWVMWTRTGGSLADWNYQGAGNNNVRLNLATSREYAQRRTAVGVNTITGYFRMYDAATGGNTLQTSSTVTWSAEYDFEACPNCCFTPDTLVTMANGMQVPIKNIKEGDRILSVNAENNDFAEDIVTGIITRYDRPMFLITFEDGRTLETSADHPIDVKGKGPASLLHYNEPYKHLPKRAMLEIGDMVSTDHKENGLYIKVKSVEPLPYKGVVLTLKNSPFFANGVLVY